MSSNKNSEFAKHLASIWPRGFDHSYEVTNHRAWNNWRRICPDENPSIWRCNSLRQASEFYSWTDAADDQDRFEKLAGELRNAIRTKDNGKAMQACWEIFKWGNVARRPNDRSKEWVQVQAMGGHLTNLLAKASQLLTGQDSLDAFDGKTLPMNSAMTKIYAACMPGKLVIYDGRVGAALGLITKQFLKSIDHEGDIPSQLAFRWGSSQRKGQASSRNPSDGNYKFPALFGYRPDRAHAEMVRATSFLLCDAIEAISEPNLRLTSLERALFMVGYDVRERQLSS